jgi:nicotinate-nucleotide adenylyltransferase
MNVGLFGGTFDPIHRGHIALARAATKQFRLSRVLFVPSSVPPHRIGRPLSPYHHRFAMVTLATQKEKSLIPSSLEAPPEPGVLAFSSGRPGYSYSIDTVRALKRELGKKDRLFFLIGIDAFADIAKWHEAEAVLREVDFVVASRRGYSLADIVRALPDSLRPPESAVKSFKSSGRLSLGATTIHLLSDLKVPISATQVRSAAERGRPLGRFLDPAVAAYIEKTHLYRRETGERRNRAEERQHS